MAGFTHLNLREIDDSAGERGPALETRFARTRLESRHLGVSLLRYGPGYRSANGHSHREQEEVYLVVSGSGRAKLDDEIVELRAWDALRVAPETVRAFEGGPEGMELVAVASDRPEGGDGVLAADWWTG